MSQRIVNAAAGDRPWLHRCQVLRLVDDHVAVARRRPGKQLPRLVQEREVAVAPAGAGPAEECLLVLVEDAVRRLGEPLT